MATFYALHSALKQPLAVEALHLDRNHLKEVPESILAFKNLRLLNLSHNQLEQLPDWLDQLLHLKTLQLQNNRLLHLSGALSTCLALQVLDLRENQLEVIDEQSLPTSTVQLNLSANHLRKLYLKKAFPELKILKINQNKLSAFPKIKQAPKLSSLELFQNKIKHWPKGIQAFVNLEKLVLSRNLLQHLPKEIDQLARLKYLDLSSNKLMELPASLGRVTPLRRLNISGNQLHQLPSNLAQLSWLVELDLSKNQFLAIPKLVQQLQRLDRLDLSRNKLGPQLNTQLPETLRVLDLSHNSIKNIRQLPAQLKILYLRKTPLERLEALQQLKNLEQLDLSLVPNKALPMGLFYLSQLKKLGGLLSQTPKKHLLQLLRSPLTPKEKRALFKFWQEGVLPSQAVLLKGLALTIPNLSKKIAVHLLKQTSAVYATLPESTAEVQFVGRLTTPKSKLTQNLKSMQLRVSEKSQWCILGRGPFPVLDPNQTYYFFNEAQLLTFLNQKKQSDLSPSQQLKLERLLLHANPKQVKMALLLLKRQSIDTQLLPALIAAWKLQSDPKLKRQLSKVIQQNQHPNYEGLRNGKLLLAEVSSVFQWLENAGFNPKDYTRWKSFFEKK